MSEVFPQPVDEVPERLREGIVIPAHPLALTVERKLDDRRQRALTRYYHDAGAGGLAVGDSAFEADSVTDSIGKIMGVHFSSLSNSVFDTPIHPVSTTAAIVISSSLIKRRY